MKLQIEAEGMDITPSIKEKVEKKLGIELDKYLMDFNEDVKTADVKVEYLPHKERFAASFNIALPKKEHIYAKYEDGNIDNVLTHVREEVERQLERYKGKLSRNK